MRAGLIALQAGLTVALLASSVAMGRTFLNLLNADLGFRPVNVVTLTVSLQGTKYQSGASRWQYYSQVLDRLRGCLVDGGILVIGGHEALPESFVGFEPLAAQRAIFRKVTVKRTRN